MAGEAVDSKDQDRARKAMIRGAQLASEDSEAHFLLGKVFSLDKDYDKASIEFQKVLSLDPKHQQASSELRVVQMRMEKEKNTSFIRWKR
jgi:predicted TPR repeat methyltransferase